MSSLANQSELKTSEDPPCSSHDRAVSRQDGVFDDTPHLHRTKEALTNSYAARNLRSMREGSFFEESESDDHKPTEDVSEMSISFQSEGERCRTISESDLLDHGELDHGELSGTGGSMLDIVSSLQKDYEESVEDNEECAGEPPDGAVEAVERLFPSSSCSMGEISQLDSNHHEISGVFLTASKDILPVSPSSEHTDNKLRQQQQSTERSMNCDSPPIMKGSKALSNSDSPGSIESARSCESATTGFLHSSLCTVNMSPPGSFADRQRSRKHSDFGPSICLMKERRWSSSSSEAEVREEQETDTSAGGRGNFSHIVMCFHAF